jgi:hypothetical protein
MPCIALQYHELRMTLVFERLQERMNLQRAEPTPENLVLFARDLLVAKEQHLMLEKRRPHLVERRIVEAPQMHALDFCAQRPGDSLNPDLLRDAHDSR